MIGFGRQVLARLPPVPNETALAGNLPPDPRGFVGRRDKLAWLVELSHLRAAEQVPLALMETCGSPTRRPAR